MSALVSSSEVATTDVAHSTTYVCLYSRNARSNDDAAVQKTEGAVCHFFLLLQAVVLHAAEL